ncbi:wall-associated receptor kinase 2 [Phtheirospermum japonicum]|uniref:Wall-associated receptor kinase 2 n=1 Tax=Phtheirospermum japonicum TaxID=374723 RepID=A0A830B2D7_9LAMI|nr:wall-associated receptor kinase 2 [Phtheirospermum japonicum]
MARFHGVSQFIFLTLTVASTSSSSPNFPIAKPGCDDRCGDVSIPFPFGTTPDCYLNNMFLISCNKSSTPHKLFLYETTTDIEITDISLDGQLTVLPYISHDCYNPNGTSRSSSSPWIRLSNTILTVNSTANKFTIIGCDTYGYFYGRRLNRDYQTRTGCMAMCGAVDDLVQGSCAGTGCCHISIPDDVWRVDLTLGSFRNYSNVSGLGNCSYAFVVKESAYTFYPQNLTNLMDVRTRMPMVTDWAIGDDTNCEMAQMNRSSYACKGANALCKNKTSNGYGYRCFCKEGYQGNPYLDGGCQDINECLNTSLNDCGENNCVNTPGSFDCTCPKGYHGDGKREGKGKGCIRGESRAYKLEAGVALGVILLLLAAWLFHLELKRRRLIKSRSKAFLGSIRT